MKHVIRILFILGATIVALGVWRWDADPQDGLTMVVSGMSMIVSATSFHYVRKTNEIWKRLEDEDG